MDRRIQKTKEAIHGAFFRLLQEKDLKKITVSEIAREANIDRKTFYLHYTCAEDVLAEYDQERVREIIGNLTEANVFTEPLPFSAVVEEVDRILNRDIESWQRLLDVNYTVFWETLHQVLVDSLMGVYADRLPMSEEGGRIYCDFLIAGILTLYKRYLKDPESLTMEQMKEIILDITSNGARTFLGERGGRLLD